MSKTIEFTWSISYNLDDLIDEVRQESEDCKAGYTEEEIVVIAKERAESWAIEDMGSGGWSSVDIWEE